MTSHNGKVYTKKFNIGSNVWEIEYGRVARQANGAVLVKVGGTVILAAVTVAKEPKEDVDFLPLTVDYRERTYAAGRIPGGFFKRETRPRDKEILVSRLIDRSIRPLFPEGFHYNMQLTVVVLSSDQENTPDILALVGASAALSLSDIPFSGPIGSVRIGMINNEIVLNPTYLQQKECDLDMVVSGRKGTLSMVESGSKNVPEDKIINALTKAQEVIDLVCDQINQMKAEIPGKEKFSFELPKQSEEFIQAVNGAALEGIKKAVRIADKSAREELLRTVRKETVEKILQTYPEQKSACRDVMDDIEYTQARHLIIKENIRTDGRKFNEVRKISCEVGVLPRTHGSAIFTRGQTQALVIVTLGSSDDKQIMDMLEEDYKERFMLNYSFPGYATGEPKPDRGPGRREVGHGALARRALIPVLPSEESFPYTIRIVSEILESNGSSSMATVCGGSLSLMDAGVQISDSVAGIAMGLVMGETGEYRILSDIIGFEDHLGDMDFKVAGTTQGINALQMDIKVEGLDINIIKEALLQAHEGRLHILQCMSQALSTPRPDLSEFAPRIVTLKIPPSKIGALIGPGGKNIRKIIEQSGAEVNVEDDGTVFVSSVSAESMEIARKMVEDSTVEAEVGKVYNGKVVRLHQIGAFVEILPGKDGLVHISQLSDHHVEKTEDVVSEGDEIKVKVLAIDKQGRINLTTQLNRDPSDYRPPSRGRSTHSRARGHSDSGKQ